MSNKLPSSSCTLSRRSLLRAGAIGAGVLALPLWPRRVRADLRPDRRARRLLVINLLGGVRSSACFHASPGSEDHNPWGVIQGTGTEFALGKLLDDFLDRATPTGRPESPLPDEAYRLLPTGGWRGARVPRLRELAPRMSVVGTWNADRGDHIRSQQEETTGAPGFGEPGLLTRVALGLERALPPAAREIPGFHVSAFTAFGQAPGDLAPSAPVRLQGPAGLPSELQLPPEALALVGRDFAPDDATRDRLDQRRLAGVRGHGKTLAETYAGHRKALRLVGARLSAPWVNVGNADPSFRMAEQGAVTLPGGERVPLTNEMLRELMLRALGPDPDDPGLSRPLTDPTQHPHYASAENAALAVRLLQLGSPAAALEIQSFDFHSAERRDGPTLYRFLGRLLASLHFLLSQLEDPAVPGTSMLEHTLVVTTSDFGRDPGRIRGFNAGEGSDHGASPACYFLGHLVFGAGVVAGRLLGRASTDTYDARSEPLRQHPRQLLATLLWSLGLPHRDELFGFPDVSEPIRGLWT